MNSIVLDSSAALAMLLGETGGDRVMKAFLRQDSIAMSAVNWSEVLTRLQRQSPIVNAAKFAAMLPGVEIVPFGQAEAERTAELAKSCGALSLGDRACLTLAHERGVPAWTMDRIWKQMPVGVNVEILR